jgi:hypothetical protein
MKKLIAAIAPIALLASPAVAGGNTLHITGQGTLNDGRVFNLNARVDQDGNVSGKATLINTNFSGDSGKGPYTAHIDISCVNVLDNGDIYLGGVTTRTNDSNLNDAVYFAVNADGSKLSRAFFFDGDPNTQGDPGLCEGNQAGDFPLEDVIRGNINVK